jgi:hypothetical protein
VRIESRTRTIDDKRDREETRICCLLQGTGESYLYNFDSTLRNTSPVQKRRGRVIYDVEGVCVWGRSDREEKSTK